MVISCASFDMTERTKIQSFLALFRASAKLSHDIQAFDRMRPDDPNNCLKYLTDAVERIISFDRLDRNRKAKIQQLSGGGGATYVAPGDAPSRNAAPSQVKAPGGGKGDGKGKKGKDKAGKGKDNAKPPDASPPTLNGITACRKFSMGHCTLSAADCFKTNGRSHISQQEVSKLLGFNPFTVSADTPKGDGKGVKGDKGKKDKGKGAKAAPTAAIPAAAVIDTTAEGQETHPLRYRGSICMEHQ